MGNLLLHYDICEVYYIQEQSFSSRNSFIGERQRNGPISIGDVTHAVMFYATRRREGIVRALYAYDSSRAGRRPPLAPETAKNHKT